jgi:hypothetical protein
VIILGYILIDEEKLIERLSLWNSKDYLTRAKIDVYSAKADTSCLFKMLQQEEEEIDKEIAKLTTKKNDLEQLMHYAKRKI